MNDWPAPTGEPTFVPYTIEQMTKIVDSFALILQSQSGYTLKIVEALTGLAKRVGDLETLANLMYKAPTAQTAPTESEGHQGMYL